MSIGVGEYPSPKLKIWSLRRWLDKLPSVKLLQKSLEINTQSMDQLRAVLYREVPTVRINNKYTEPALATDMLEADLTKLGSFGSAAVTWRATSKPSCKSSFRKEAMVAPSEAQLETWSGQGRSHRV